MLLNKTVAVIVPAYNEERRIVAVIKSMPAFVDRIIVINDGSSDNTGNVVLALLMDKGVNFHVPLEIETYQDNSVFTQPNFPDFTLNTQDLRTDRIVLLNHHINCGKGAGIKTGYAFSKMLGFDCVATMDGDGQMNPEELEKICLPIVEGVADYVKGDRLTHKDAWHTIPPTRLWGNLLLSALTKPASGYWKVRDTQTGFTAISKKALQRIPIASIYEYYGYPNDILVKLNIADCTIKEVCVQPIYHDISNSKMKIYRVIPRISWLLTRSFFERVWTKYLFNSPHPIFFLYHLSLALFLWGCYKGIVGTEGDISGMITCYIIAIVSGLVALYWDMKKNTPLYLK